MNKKILLIAATIMTAAMVGCTTQPIPQSTVISASPAVANSGIANTIKTTIQGVAHQGWIVERADANQVIAGIHLRGHYLQLTYSIQQNQVTSRITASQNLEQHGEKIHRNALKWKANLDQKVFARLTAQ
ncbi:MAG: hypothetical protein QM666_06180 [Acinetobacter sp.]